MSDAYAPPPDGQPPPEGWQRDYYTNPHRGTLILVFGILGIVVCGIFGIVSWAMGNKDLLEIREGRMDPSGEGLTQAGRICGIIGTILMIFGAAMTVLMFILFFAAVAVQHQ